MGRHARRSGGHRLRIARGAGRRARLGRIRARLACLRGADEAKPRPSCSPAAGGGGERRGSRGLAAGGGLAPRDRGSCHRSSQEPLDAGGRLLAATQPGRTPRVLVADSTRRAAAVVLAREADPVDEAFFCAREIKRLHAEWPELRLRDFAIVLRSTTALGPPFEEALRA